MRIEYIFALCVSVFFVSIIYLNSTKNKIDNLEEELNFKKGKIIEIKELQTNWDNQKDISDKISSLKNNLKDESIKLFENKKRAFNANLINLPPNTFNKFMKDVWNTKMQIVFFAFRENNNLYEVELKCKY